MYLLASNSPEITTRFEGPLRKKGQTTVVGSLAELWQDLARHPAKLILIDFGLLASGPQAEIAKTRQLTPDAKILVVAAGLSPEVELSLLGMGAAACCGAQLAEDTITRIINTVLDGGTWISSAALPLLLKGLGGLATTPAASRPGAAERLASLTPREGQIAELVASGASNKLIARQLDITDRTVKAHLSAIFQKLGVSDRLQLALYVTGSGLSRSGAAPP
ncbi:MAG: response regulator transcription factor [Gammaproteobacteria bacterium]|nr:response regulator transcription factor [Gammaproteobacteria bacterium]